ncbi:MAG: HAMP domain-containing histidine kinase [Verrucomicrobia bacterium]|nr:HAMP domain-containing histidine kinase [Verrucomicrobiota bacterium]
MLPASRRILLFWLLLLVPTLVVGAGAILLLRREADRLRQQGGAVAEARRAALATQARLVVENVELFAGDVQNGMLDTLAGESGGSLEMLFVRWERENPLVRIGFRAQPGGRLLRPQPQNGDGEAAGFVRRFSTQFGARPPWGAEATAKDAKSEAAAPLGAPAVSGDRQLALQNVMNTQSARRDLQQLVGPTPSAVAEQAAPAARSERRLAADSTSSSGAPLMKAAAMPVRAAPHGVRGWKAFEVEGRWHIIGWVQPVAGGEVRGVELRWQELVQRLGAALPASALSGEGLALRDARGRVVHQVGAVQAEVAPVARLPLAVGILPGWEVAAYLAPGYDSLPSAGFASLGILLVGLFMIAILAGGYLLLWQARNSEAEAQQKTSFVANVSHEFKTPLTTIRLYSELLEQGRVRDPEQGREYLRTIGRETQRLARLVNNALDFSRLEQGRKRYVRENLNLAAELGRLLDTLAPRVAEAGLSLERDLANADLSVATDRDALQQIVTNLVDNACKYAAEGRVVAVAAGRREKGGVEVRVADRGPGVPTEQRERIFEKFHRVDETLTAERTGTGLGLSIARQLARGLGGDLRCAARHGGGAEFVLELP